MFAIRMTKHRSTWQYFTENPQGGGFGSTHCGARRVALHKALRAVPDGGRYSLTINDKARGTFTAGAVDPQPPLDQVIRAGDRLPESTARNWR